MYQREIESLTERVAALGGEIAGHGPKDAAKFIAEQTELWGKVVQLGNIKPE